MSLRAGCARHSCHLYVSQGSQAPCSPAGQAEPGWSPPGRLCSPSLVGNLHGEAFSMPSPCPGLSGTVPPSSITLCLAQGSGRGLHPGHEHKPARIISSPCSWGRNSAAGSGCPREAEHADVPLPAEVKGTGVRAETSPWLQHWLPVSQARLRDTGTAPTQHSVW